MLLCKNLLPIITIFNFTGLLVRIILWNMELYFVFRQCYIITRTCIVRFQSVGILYYYMHNIINSSYRDQSKNKNKNRPPVFVRKDTRVCRRAGKRFIVIRYNIVTATDSNRLHRIKALTFLSGSALVPLPSRARPLSIFCLCAL